MTARTLDVAVVQIGELTEDIADNLSRLVAAVDSAATGGGSESGGAEGGRAGSAPDLVVLPELITTPYFCTSHDTDRTSWAQTIPGDATARLGALARERRCAIAFGTYERTADGTTHNSVVLIDSAGEIVDWRTPGGGHMPAYRKLSLPASKVSGVDIDEKYHFAPGPSPATAELHGIRIGCVICYDRTFPEYWAVARALGAEVMLAVVSSLGSREDLFLAELQTRALESQTWVIAANRAGPETLNGATVDYFGLSCVIAPDGEIVARAPAHRSGETLRVTIDLDRVAQVRAALPLRRDRRADVVSLFADLTAGICR
ncbi:carbon-nitrogen hydrolase family protein [Gordonia jinghuaiqii]|uniref:Carbon-nitrogen hydrolase family protein n=1 Tax=Gordonia jinghuaiqii TaxID=2758710 RepID=A0A7D7LQU7_9ACTN|nr:carbon-nitrogen hydrolase family protein [Gordonia jinghuaiqii]MCR5979275.1 carbon-nitrogen hydrolase family protein [Gordonia jinghuaiqii]QMT01063.1 carbon-nitrogen hydrolase family protein [Gordonia jinghuaiqii]